MRLSFGIKTSQMGLTYTDILPVWQDADRVPLFEHGWLWDHMVPLRGDVRGAALEAWTLLGALAAQTVRLRLGVMVTSNRLRNPALLAKMAATVDVISGGRLDFGIGAGGSQLPGAPDDLAAIVRREFEAYGVPIVPASEGDRAGVRAARGRSTQNGQFQLDSRVRQEDELVLEGVLPIDHVLVELHAVTVFACVLELVERPIFGVQQGPVLQKEVVVDRLVHVVLLPAARPLRAGGKTILLSRVVRSGGSRGEPDRGATPGPFGAARPTSGAVGGGRSGASATGRPWRRRSGPRR